MRSPYGCPERAIPPTSTRTTGIPWTIVAYGAGPRTLEPRLRAGALEDGSPDCASETARAALGPRRVKKQPWTLEDVERRLRRSGAVSGVQPVGVTHARLDVVVLGVLPDLHQCSSAEALGRARAARDRKEMQEVPGPCGEFDHFAGGLRVRGGSPRLGGHWGRCASTRPGGASHLARSRASHHSP